MRGALLAVLASLLLAGCPANGNYYSPNSGYYDNSGYGYDQGYNQGYSQDYGGGYANAQANCVQEFAPNGQRYLNCDRKVADSCSSERNNYGQRYWRCPEGSYGRGGYGGGYGYRTPPPPVEYTGVARGCRPVQEGNGDFYYICSERQGGMHCDSERTNSGQRYYQCRP